VTEVAQKLGRFVPKLGQLFDDGLPLTKPAFRFRPRGPEQLA
jgi:hypothetical protein